MKQIIKTPRKFWRNRQGTAAVEFVLTLPVLLVILVAVVDLARALHDFHTFSRGLRDGTRYLSRVAPANLGIDCSGAGVLNQAAPEVDQAKNLVMTAYANGGANLLSYWDAATNKSDITVSVSCMDKGAYAGIYEADAKIPRITMNANVTFSVLLGQIINLGDIAMQASHTETYLKE